MKIIITILSVLFILAIGYQMKFDVDHKVSEVQPGAAVCFIDADFSLAGCQGIHGKEIRQMENLYFNH